MRKFLIHIAVLFFFVAAAYAENKSDPIKIGVDYAFTGAAQVWSDYGRMGLELARDEINAAGGIHGRKIELVFEDSRTIPAHSVAAYHKLVSVDGVKIVIGDVWAFLTNPLIPLAERDKVVLISPTVMDSSVEKSSDYFFTLGYRYDSIRGAIEKFFDLNPDIKTTGLICWDDPWGQAQLKLWHDILSKRGIKITGEVCQNDFNNDYRTDVTRIAAGKPDAVLIAYWIDRIAQRMHEQHFSAKVLTGSDMMEALTVRKMPLDLADGVYFTNWQPNEEFTARFKAKFGKPPIMEAHDSYEALRSIARALDEQSSDLVSALRKVKYTGVAGPIDFSGGPFVNKGLGALYRVGKNGSIEKMQ